MYYKIVFNYNLLKYSYSKNKKIKNLCTLTNSLLCIYNFGGVDPCLNLGSFCDIVLKFIRF